MRSEILAEPRELVFPDGLVGLPDLRRFRLGRLEGTSLLELSALDAPGMEFVAAVAEDVVPGVTEQIGAHVSLAPEDVVLVLLSVHGDPPVVTANLAGPVVLNLMAGTGRQLVVEDVSLPLRAPVGAPA